MTLSTSESRGVADKHRFHKSYRYVPTSGSTTAHINYTHKFPPLTLRLQLNYRLAHHVSDMQTISSFLYYATGETAEKRVQQTNTRLISIQNPQIKHSGHQLTLNFRKRKSDKVRGYSPGTRDELISSTPQAHTIKLRFLTRRTIGFRDTLKRCHVS